MESIFGPIFWISVGVTIYAYFLYPVLLVVLAVCRQAFLDVRYAASARNRRRLNDAQHLPAVTMVFAAYNEEAVIPAKMANCASIDYPPEKLEILIGCDGCSDNTVALAESAGLAQAQVLDLRPRSGKPSVLNRVSPRAKGDIIVFSDANTMYAPGTIRSLVRHFSDPAIGCVCGELRLQAPDGSPNMEGAYWRYEVFLKFFESRLNMLLGANGGVFAIRRSLWDPLPKHAIIDDFLIAMKVTEKGYRSVYDREAVAYETVAPDVKHEFHRRTRIAAGHFHAFVYTWRLLMPWAGPVAFSYWSHKAARYLVPFALITAFISAVALSFQDSRYLLCVAGGLGFLALASAGYRMEARGKIPAAFSVPYYFISMNLALLIGFVRFVTRGQSTVWRRTAREKKA